MRESLINLAVKGIYGSHPINVESNINPLDYAKQIGYTVTTNSGQPLATFSHKIIQSMSGYYFFA